MLGQFVGINTLIELAQVLGESEHVLSMPKADRKQIGQRWRSFDQKIVERFLAAWLLHGAVHANPQRGCSMWPIFVGYHEGDVVDWAVPCRRFLLGELLEHPPLDSFFELLVEGVQVSLLDELLLQSFHAGLRLVLVVLEDGRRGVEGVLGCPLALVLVQHEPLLDDGQLIVLLPAQGLHLVCALLAILASATTPWNLCAHGLRTQEVRGGEVALSYLQDSGRQGGTASLVAIRANFSTE